MNNNSIESASNKFHIPSLDGLRAVAICIVFLSHAGLSKIIPGGLGVTIFFFLSGYLITTLLRLEHIKTGKIDLKKFYIRRMLRIWPNFYLVLFFHFTCSSSSNCCQFNFLAIMRLSLSNKNKVGVSVTSYNWR